MSEVKEVFPEQQLLPGTQVFFLLFLYFSLSQHATVNINRQIIWNFLMLLCLNGGNFNNEINSTLQNRTGSKINIDRGNLKMGLS